MRHFIRTTTILTALLALPFGAAAQDLGGFGEQEPTDDQTAGDAYQAESAGTEAEPADTFGAPYPEESTAPAAAPLEDTAPGGDWANKAGTLGFGGDTTLGGTAGAHARYFVNDDIGLQVALGLGILSASVDVMGGGTVDRSGTALTLGFSGTYKIHGWSDGHMSLLGGIDISSTSFSQEVGGMSTDSSTFAFGLSAGIFAEWFVTDFLSFHGQTGLRIAFGSQDSGGASTSLFALGTGGDTFAGFGFTFWMI